MPESKETKRLRSLGQDLENAIVPELIWVAGQMNAAHLLSDTQHKDVTTVPSFLTDEQKAGKIVEALKAKVKGKSANYDKFLVLLREREDDFEDIIEKLEFSESEETATSSKKPKPHPPSLNSGDILDTIDDTTLGEPEIDDDLGDVVEVLTGLVARWRDIATYLRLRAASMDTIAADHGGNALRCLQCAMTDWLRLNYNTDKNGPPSWRQLAKAVRSVDGKTFDKIAKDHPAATLQMEDNQIKVEVAKINTTKLTQAHSLLPKVSPPKTTEPHYPILDKNFDMGKLDLLKWTDERGLQRLRLVQEMSPKWEKIGEMIGVADAELQAWNTEYCKEAESCLRRVLRAWVQRTTAMKYKPTWYGLIELIEDLELSNLKDEILKAAASGNGNLYAK